MGAKSHFDPRGGSAPSPCPPQAASGPLGPAGYFINTTGTLQVRIIAVVVEPMIMLRMRE